MTVARLKGSDVIVIQITSAVFVLQKNYLGFF